MMRREGVVRVVVILTLVLITSYAVNAQADIQTDKTEYEPGETVLITGTGWWPGEQVEVQLIHIEPNVPDHIHESWKLTADFTGSIQDEWFVTEEELGTNFHLIAIGMESQQQAETFFSDGIETYIYTEIFFETSVYGDRYDIFKMCVNRTSATSKTIVEGYLRVFNEAGDNIGSYYLLPGGICRTLPAHWVGKAGVHLLTIKFYDPKEKYQSSESTLIHTQHKADAVLNMNGGSWMYDGLPHSGTGTATGKKGENLSSLIEFDQAPVDAPGGKQKWLFLGNINYHATSGEVDIIINPVEAEVIVQGSNAIYNANPVGAIGTATGINDLDLSHLIDPGTLYVNVPGGKAHWKFNGAPNYLDEEGEVDIVIDPATAVFAVEGYTGTYDGKYHGISGGVLGVNLDIVEGFNPGESFINYPGGTAKWSFTDPLGNYLPATGEEIITINKATIAPSIHHYSGAYDGEYHTGTVMVKGVCDDTPGTVQIVGQFIDHPGGQAQWLFTDPEGNYHDASGTVDVVIDRANPNIEVQGWEGFFDGLPHGATAIVSGVKGEPLEGFDPGESFSAVPGGTAHWTFTDVTGNYNPAEGYVDITIHKPPTEAVMMQYAGTRLAAALRDTALIDLRVVVEGTEGNFETHYPNATLSLFIDDGQTIITRAFTISANDLMDDNSAVVSTLLKYPLGTATSRTLHITALAEGSFSGIMPTAIAIAYKPDGDHITGGGYITLTPQAAGVLAPLTGSPVSFGFNFKYQKKASQVVLHGDAQLTFRTEDGYWWQLKCVKPLSMGIYAGDVPPAAQFSALVDLYREDSPVALYNDLMLYVTLTDAGNPGTRDDMGITLWDGNTLLLSNHWQDGYTHRQGLAGGNLVIHRGGTTTPIDDFELRQHSGTQLLLYPNPCHRVLYIEYTPPVTGPCSITILNAIGQPLQVIFRGEGLKGKTIPLTYLPTHTGLMFCRVVSPAGVSTHRFVVKQ